MGQSLKIVWKTPTILDLEMPFISALYLHCSAAQVPSMAYSTFYKGSSNAPFHLSDSSLTINLGHFQEMTCIKHKGHFQRRFQVASGTPCCVLNILEIVHI